MQKITINELENMDFQGKEAYKTLRTNIEFAGEDTKVITVTSCMPNEGKSSVAMNLAISLAEAEKSILLIDADMRKSVLTGRHKIKNAQKGLSHYLSGQCNMDEMVSVTNIDKFHMVVAGPVPPNPSELLTGKRFEEFLKKMKTVYEYIIIDCPPLGSVVDGLIVGKLSDGVIMVIESEGVSYKFAQRVKKQLEMADCKILGAVLNKVNLKSNSYYKKYYGKHYYYKREI